MNPSQVCEFHLFKIAASVGGAFFARLNLELRLPTTRVAFILLLEQRVQLTFLLALRRD